MEKLVTIVIPVLNREDTLPRLFASLKAVTYPRVEIIFVDNGSTDSSVKLIKSFAADITHYALRIMHCPKTGAAAARNVGLTAAQGEYISFFDSDDEMSDTFIADMVRMMEPTSNETELAVARTRSVFDSGRTMVRARGGNTVEAHIIAQGLNTASWVARTELVRRVGGWNEELLYWDDYELGVRLLLASKETAWSDNVYHRTYEHEGPRLTTTNGQLRVERSRQALDAIERDIATMGTQECLPSIKALNLRRAIVRGQLEQKGLDAHGIECNGWIAQTLRRYTRLGGRGAWRIALIFAH